LPESSSERQAHSQRGTHGSPAEESESFRDPGDVARAGERGESLSFCSIIRLPTPPLRRRPSGGGSIRSRLGVGILALVALMSATANTDAHPHVWIETVATFVFDRGKVVGIKLEWTLDEFFSESLIDTFDPKKKGRFDEKAVKELYKRDFDNLKNSDYFIHLSLAGKKLPIREVSDFSAAVVKGRVVYRFTARLPSPVDPVGTTIGLSVYDESYFVEVAFAEEDPIRFEGGADALCRCDVREDRNTPLYFGMAFPQQIRLECRRR